MTRAFRYVRFAEVEDFLRLGWMVSIPNAPAHHEHYGIVLKWICDCPIPRAASEPNSILPVLRSTAAIP